MIEEIAYLQWIRARTPPRDPVTVGPGDVVFFPSGIRHADITYHTQSMRYLTIRTVEPEDDACCCGGDKDAGA